jgi:hypothetical protein
MKFLIGVALLFSSPALAQEQRTPSQTALAINGVIAQWALTVEAQAKQIVDLQKQLDEAKAKCEAPK